MSLELQEISVVFFPSKDISRDAILQIFDTLKQSKELAISNFSINTDVSRSPIEIFPFPLLSFNIDSWQCAFRRNRIDCQIKLQNLNAISESIFIPLTSIFNKISNDITMNRLGFVARYIFKGKSSDIRNHFFKEEFCKEELILMALVFANKITKKNTSFFDNIQITDKNIQMTDNDKIIIRDLNTGILPENLNSNILQDMCNEAVKLFSKSAIETVIYGSISK